jgi:DNA-binding response OmpR family regulator
MASGAYDYVVKPFDLNYLENVLLMKMVDILG